MDASLVGFEPTDPLPYKDYVALAIIFLTEWRYKNWTSLVEFEPTGSELEVYQGPRTAAMKNFIQFLVDISKYSSHLVKNPKK